MKSLMFLSPFVAAFSTVTVKDCSSGKSFFKVQSFSFSPDIPVGGQNGTLHSIYEVPMTVTGGNTKYSCTLNGLPVYSETFDLCTQTACPVTAGIHDDFSISEVPSVSGKVSCTIVWRDSANTQLLCIQTIMNLVAAEKKNLRGATLHTCMRYTPLLSTNLSENVTFAPLQNYDPEETYYAAPAEFEDDINAPAHFHTHADHAKMALMILRSGPMPLALRY